jgi:hypothetical protein
LIVGINSRLVVVGSVVMAVGEPTVRVSTNALSIIAHRSTDESKLRNRINLLKSDECADALKYSLSLLAILNHGNDW